MIAEFTVKYIKHSLLSVENAKRIALLKQQHWNYSTESQIKWMKENINDNEYHLWFENTEGEIIAYLNIVFLQVKLDDGVEENVGIGNVCVDKRFAGQGLGLLLMQTCNYYIGCGRLRAVLLCKKKLSGFYQKSGWSEFAGEVILQGKAYEDVVMFNELPCARSITIERNF